MMILFRIKPACVSHVGLAVIAPLILSSVLRAAEPDPSLPIAEIDATAASTQRELRPGMRPIPMKIRRYCHRLLSRHDLNNDGVLQSNEWSTLPAATPSIDVNSDQTIDLDELMRWTASYGTGREIGISRELPKSVMVASAVEAIETDTPIDAPIAPPALLGERRRDAKFYVPSKRLPAGLPEWFHGRDEDGDAQLTLAEFSPTGAPADTAEFNRLDLNRDGVMTAKECVGQAAGEKVTTPDQTGTGEVPTPAPRRKPNQKRAR